VKLTHSYQKYHGDDDTSVSLSVSSIFLQQGKVNKPTKDTNPSPKNPHVTPSTFYCAGGVAEPLSEHVCATTKNNSTTCCVHAIAQPKPPLPFVGAARISMGTSEMS
jgi:hypothetical protein